MQYQLDEGAEANFHRKNIGVLQHRPWKAKMIVKLNLISFVDSPTRFAHFCSSVDLPEAPFARPGRGQGPKLCDVNEEIDPPEIKRTHGPQAGSSLQTVNLCMHGLVLLNQ